MKLFPLFWLGWSAMAGVFLVDGDIQVSGNTVLLLVGFALVAFNLYFQRQALQRHERRLELLGKHNHTWRNNYMVLLYTYNGVIQMVTETRVDQATKYKLEDIRKEVDRQLAELQKEAKRQNEVLDPSNFVRAADHEPR